jgi:hypothetical protein
MDFELENEWRKELPCIFFAEESQYNFELQKVFESPNIKNVGKTNRLH